MKMTTETEVESFSQSISTAFLFKSLKRLYIYAQFVGCACFSYSHGRVYVTRLNYLSLVSFTGIYLTAAYLNFTLEKTTDANGYQAMLFHIGEHLIPSYGIFFMWTTICVFFLARKKVARIMLDIILLDGEVSKLIILLQVTVVNYSSPVGQMREANMIAEHVNYLLRSEIVFWCIFVSGIIMTTLCCLYMNYCVNGSRLAEIMIELCFFVDSFIGLFLVSILGINLLHCRSNQVLPTQRLFQVSYASDFYFYIFFYFIKSFIYTL